MGLTRRRRDGLVPHVAGRGPTTAARKPKRDLVAASGGVEDQQLGEAVSRRRSQGRGPISQYVVLVLRGGDLGGGGERRRAASEWRVEQPRSSFDRPVTLCDRTAIDRSRPEPLREGQPTSNVGRPLCCSTSRRQERSCASLLRRRCLRRPGYLRPGRGRGGRRQAGLAFVR